MTCVGTRARRDGSASSREYRPYPGSRAPQGPAVSRLTLSPSWRSVIHLGVFAATSWEFTAIRRALTVHERRRMGGGRCLIGRRAGRRVVLVQSGIGLNRAEQISRGVLAGERLDLVISTGFAVALVPAGIGDLALATEVGILEAPGATWQSVPGATDMDRVVTEVARRMAVRVHIGRFVSTSRILCHAREKREVASTGAIAADMESASLGRVAAEHGLPFAAVRSVSDLVDEELPLDFNRFLTAGGWLRGIVDALHPPALVGLLRLRRQSVVAANQLTTFMAHFLDLLEDCAPPEEEAFGQT